MVPAGLLGSPEAHDHQGDTVTDDRETELSLALDREELTLREQLVRALNGHMIHRDSAVEILRRWDAAERFAEEVRA